MEKPKSTKKRRRVILDEKRQQFVRVTSEEIEEMNYRDYTQSVLDEDDRSTSRSSSQSFRATQSIFKLKECINKTKATVEPVQKAYSSLEKTI